MYSLKNTKLKMSLLFLVITIILTLAILPSIVKAESIWNSPEFSVQIGPNGPEFQGRSQEPWRELLNKYKGFITGVSGVAAVTMVVLFIIQFLKLGASAGNANARSQALKGCMWTGIAAAGLGAVSVIVGIFYKAF